MFNEHFKELIRLPLQITHRIVQVRVRFQSDYRDQFRGFNLTWNTID